MILYIALYSVLREFCFFRLNNHRRTTTKWQARLDILKIRRQVYQLKPPAWGPESEWSSVVAVTGTGHSSYRLFNLLGTFFNFHRDWQLEVATVNLNLPACQWVAKPDSVSSLSSCQWPLSSNHCQWHELDFALYKYNFKLLCSSSLRPTSGNRGKYI